MGRPAKPLIAHRAQNTLRMDRHASRLGELEVSDGVGAAPNYLPAEAKKEWKRLAKHPQYGRVLTSLDRAGFAEYCWLHARTVADICGTSVEREFAKPGDLLVMTASDGQRLHSLRMQLGLTPASRSKITLPVKPAENKWQKLASSTVTPIAT